MPSNINPRSGPFPVYSSTSPPVVDVGPFVIAKTGVNLKAAATTTIFAVPTSRTYFCTGYHILVTAVTTGGAGVEIAGITESGGSRNMIQVATSASTTPVAGVTAYSAFGTTTGGVNAVAAAGTNVQIVISTSQAGSTAVTGTVLLSGFYTQ